MKSKRFSIFIRLRTAIFIFSFLAVISCRKKPDTPLTVNGNSADSVTQTVSNNMDTGKITYLALGDSYTIGESVSTAQRFPVQLVDLLEKENVHVENPDIVAVTGWTTGNLLNAIQHENIKHNYSFVTLLIGVNNQYQRRSLDEYRTQFSILLDSAVHYAGDKKDNVIVLSIPDYSVTPFANGSDKENIAMQIDQFNDANKIIAANYGVQYLDITGISREVKNDPGLVAPDGLHPSAAQYLQWDKLLAPLVLKVVK